MKNRDVAIVGFCVCFGIACFVWGTMWMQMAKDLQEKVEILERENKSYKWQIDRVTKCEVEFYRTEF